MQINNINIKNYQETDQTSLNKDDALQKKIKEMGLRETNAKGVYCEHHNPAMPKGDYSNQRHYVWNESTQQMEELPGIYYISAQGRDKNGSAINNATLQSKLQGYEFTEMEGVYSKNGKNYKYNTQTNSFEEVVNNNFSTSDTTNNQPSIADLYEEIVNGETKSEPNKIPKKEVAREEQHDLCDYAYSIVQYDADNEYIGETIYNLDGSIRRFVERENYDDGSSKIIDKDADGTVTGINMFDNQGRNIGFEFYRSGELTTKAKKEYNADGSYTEILDDYWDSRHEHRVSEYDSDGRMLSSTSTLPDGSVTNTKCYNYENDISLYIETNEAGEIIFITSRTDEGYVGTSVNGDIDDYKNRIEDIEKEIQETQLKFTYLDFPVPPNRNITTDPEQFDLEMKEYEEAKQHYDEECRKLNESLNSSNEWLQHYENTIQLLEFLGNMTHTELDIADLKANGDSEKADALQKELDKQIEEFATVYAEKNKKDWEVHKLLTELNSLSQPYLQSKSEFYDENGNFDELGYEKAIEEYEEARKEYDKQLTDLQKKIDTEIRANDDLKKKLDNLAKGSATDTTNSSIEKNAEYDETGKVTHTYTTNADGSRSDVYYTYEDGVLVQTQETIHYPDGNYTYIFKDADGNLKEEQKVIHNGLGGLTFDCTFGNGTRHVSICDENDKFTKSIYYSSNGKIEEIEEYSYDSQNHDIYKVTIKDSQGKVIREELWENYTFTDNEGNEWYGSRLKKRNDYAESGDLTCVREFQHDSNLNMSSNITYDKNGNVTNYAQLLYSTDGKLSSVIEYEFGDNGKVENGQIEGAISYRQYWYDAEGNVIKEEYIKL